MNDTAPQPSRTLFVRTTSRGRWYHFTLREAMLGIVALAGLLGWWINLPRFGNERTQFFATFDPLQELKSMQLPINSSGSRGQAGLRECTATIEGSPSGLIDILKDKVQTALEKEAGLHLISRSTGGGNGGRNFTYRYRKGKLEGVVVVRAFMTTTNDQWQLFYLNHEMSVKR